MVIFFIVIAFFVLFVGGIAAYYLARFMKGKLSIELSRSSANAEQLITGQVTMEAKKNIHGLLKVSLVGYVKRTQRDHDGRKTTEHIEVYRYDHTLEDTRDFQPGFQQAYPFDLLAPTPQEVQGSATALKKVAGGKVHWHVESRLDADGVDLYTKEACQVNLDHLA